MKLIKRVIRFFTPNKWKVIFSVPVVFDSLGTKVNMTTVIEYDSFKKRYRCYSKDKVGNKIVTDLNWVLSQYPAAEAKLRQARELE